MRDVEAQRTLPGWMWFCGWILVGIGAAFGFVSFPLALPVAAVSAWILSRRYRRSDEALGAITGVGLLLLFVAYVQRHGPGEYCHSIGTPRYPGTECGDYADPLPFLVAGLTLVVTGVVSFIVRRRRLTEL
jgi:hypothetical protein